MKRFALFAGALLLVATPALAQTDGTVVITPPGQPPALVPPGGSAEGANSVPGSTGSVSPPPAGPKTGPRLTQLGTQTPRCRAARLPIPASVAVAAVANPLGCRDAHACKPDKRPSSYSRLSYKSACRTAALPHQKLILRNVVARLALDASASREDVRAVLDQMRDEGRSAARNELGTLTSIDEFFKNIAIA